MKSLKLSYINKEWAFVNSNPICNEYYTKNGSDFVSEIEKIKPIYNEFKLLSDEHLGAYSSFEGSPVSKGILQFDMWDVTPSDMYDWDTLKNEIKEHGIRNSLLISAYAYCINISNFG